MKEGISVVIPAYMEAENLKVSLPPIKKVLAESGIEHEIIVVDSVQKLDATQEVCKENGVICVSREGDSDLYGDAVKTGIKKASLSYMIFMDADGSQKPEYIPVFYERMKQGDVDMIIGSRYVKGGTGHEQLSLILMSYVLNITYRIVLGIKIKDTSHGFRLYKTEQLKAVPLRGDDFDIVEEMLVKLMLTKKDYKMVELPIIFTDRTIGKSKKKLFKYIISYIRTLFWLKKIQLEAKKQKKREE